MSVIAVILGYGAKFAGHIYRLTATKTAGTGNNRYITDEEGRLMTWNDINKCVLEELQSAMDYHLFKSHYEHARLFATTNKKDKYGEDAVEHNEIQDLDAVASANEIQIVPTISLIGRDGDLSYRRFKLYHMRYRSLKGIQEKTREHMALAGFFREDDQRDGFISCQHCRDEEVSLRSSFSGTLRRHAIDNPRCKITHKPWSVQKKELTRKTIDSDQIVIHTIMINRERIYLKKAIENQQRELRTLKSQESSDTKALKVMETMQKLRSIPKSNPATNYNKILEGIHKMIVEAKDEGIGASKIDDIRNKLNAVLDGMKQNMCVSCLSAEATIVQLPCFHKILCADCYRRRRRVRTSRKEAEDDCDMCKSPIAIASATFPKADMNA